MDSAEAVNNRPAPAGRLIRAVNAFRADPDLARCLGYNTLTGRVEIVADLPWRRLGIGPTEWSDGDDIQATVRLQLKGVNVGERDVASAVHFMASEAPFDPLREHIELLPEWDGWVRLAGFGSTYLGCTKPSPITDALPKLWFTGAIARAVDPGAKMDCALVLIGDQGVGKSTVARILGGPFFAEGPADFHSRDSREALRGVWICELGELAGLNRSESESVKAFLSATEDRYRPAYGRRTVSFPRRAAFIGTTNSDEFLSDATGGRRFWPLPVGAIDIEALSRDRDQLWAEALHYYNRGDSWWLNAQTKWIETDLIAAQGLATVADPWLQTVASFLTGQTRVTADEVFSLGLGITAANRKGADGKRLAAVMRALKWKKQQLRDGDKRPWLYVPVE